MWPYWVFYLLPAFIAINQKPVRLPVAKKWPVIWKLVFFLLIMFIGFRYEVGGDWYNYLKQFESPYHDFSLQGFLTGDPAYKLLLWIALNFGGGMVLINAVASVIFAWGLVTFCRAQPRSWLALTVAIPYLVIVVAMGYTRQGISIGLLMLAIVALSERQTVRYFIFMSIAVLFHKSAIVILPLVALASPGSRWLKLLLVGITGALLYWFLVRETADALVNNYVGAEYNSSGAAIRIAMNALPAGIFLLFRKRFMLPKAERSFWTMMSILAFVFIGLFLVSPSSTAVDRLALYWIPLQLFVFSRLPDVFGRPGAANSTWVFLILLFYATVQAVWLLYATNAFGWLPYKFFPWEWLWDLPGKIRPFGD